MVDAIGSTKFPRPDADNRLHRRTFSDFSVSLFGRPSPVPVCQHKAGINIGSKGWMQIRRKPEFPCAFKRIFILRVNFRLLKSGGKSSPKLARGQNRNDGTCMRDAAFSIR